MTTFPSFEDAFDEVWKTAEKWQEDFSNMTFEEFHDFFEYVYCNRLTYEMESGKLERTHLYSRLPMLISLCSKLLESGHFLDGMSQDWRNSTETIAITYFNLLMSLCDTEHGTAVKKAWDIQKDHCDRFGYKSGVIFEVLAPHRVFS
jgi:hypothetical protein